MKLKKYTDKYYNFVYEVKKEAYKQYVIECFGEWDKDKQKQFFKEYIDSEKNNILIIDNNNVDIGFYAGKDIDEDTYEIGNICIKKEYQGHGIGTDILKEMIDKNKSKNIILQYFKQNPVGNLYKRLGFEFYEEKKYHYVMIKRR